MPKVAFTKLGRWYHLPIKLMLRLYGFKGYLLTDDFHGEIRVATNDESKL